MDREQRLRIMRIVSLLASILISLSAGTNYVYSAYAPQLGEKLHLSAKETNLIGTFGNLGMYLSGIPSGLLIDQRGPRPPIMIGAVLLFVGYYPIHLAMLKGLGSIGVPALCFFSTLTGIGSCMTFGGAMKIAAMNFPHHRGTATACTLAAFGLSAFFFSRLSSWLFPGNSEDFLLVLATATSGITFVSFFFCRVVPVPGTYSALPAEDPEAGSNNTRLHRTKSGEGAPKPGMYNSFDEESGTPSTVADRASSPPSLPHTSLSASAPASNPLPSRAPNPDPEANEISSLFSKSTSSSDAEENLRDLESSVSNLDTNNDMPCRPRADIRGWALLQSGDFWMLFIIMGSLAGVGLMTINNVGSDAQALWKAYDPSKSPESVHQSQGTHVSILSVCSFSGRLLSGISSDFLWKLYRVQRVWLLFASSVVFFFGQLSGYYVSNPLYLWLISSLNGIGYGMLFGVTPTIVSEYFSMRHLSTNWGSLTVAAVIGGNTVNMFYGKVYDDHSVFLDEEQRFGHRECTAGLDCYRNAYAITAGMSIVGAITALTLIRRNRDGYNPGARKA